MYYNSLCLPDVLEYTRSLPLSGSESVILFEITFDVRNHFSHTNHIQRCSPSFWVNVWTRLFVPHHHCLGVFEHNIYTFNSHLRKLRIGAWILEEMNIKAEFGYGKTLVLSWLLVQQNWLGFVRLSSSEHQSLKLFWASDISPLLWFSLASAQGQAVVCR